MNILVVSQYYYPENFQVTPICEQLVKDGHKVTVLTGLPNYPKGEVLPEYTDGKRREENINGVHVIRCYERGRKKGAVNLGINYLSFCISSLLKIRKLKGDFDCIFVYQLSPVIMGLAARYYAKKRNLPLYLYCCDLWPESIKMYIKSENNIAYKIIKKISKYIYDACDVISVQSKTFIEYFKDVHNIDEKNLIYIPAFADGGYLAKNYKLDNGITDFVFLGNIGIAQDLGSVIAAVDLIRDCDFKLHIVGDGSYLEELKRIVKAKALEDKVIFYGRRPVEEMEDFYRLADACLVSLKADNKTGLTLPAKVQGYMAAGKPVIGMIDGAANNVIKEAQAGDCVNAGNIYGLANIMKDFISNKDKFASCGDNGRKYFIDNFKKEIIVNQIEDVLYKLKNRLER